MVEIAGKYQLQSNENLVEYLKGLDSFIGSEVTDELANTIDALRPTLDVSVDGDKISLVSNAGSSASFTLGVPFEDEILTGVKVTSVATLSGDKLTIESTSGDNRKGLREYLFDESGLVIIYSGGNSNVTAKRTYTRI
ncbi:putative lipid binding protein [Trypoxylus dichotomus]